MPSIINRIFLISLLLGLAGCVAQSNSLPAKMDVQLEMASESNHDTYNVLEVGHSQLIEFGTVLRARKVSIAYIADTPTQSPAMATAARNNNTAVQPAVAASKKDGMEYIVLGRTGKTYSIAEIVNGADTVFSAGDHVLIQVNGTYQRLLPADHLPRKIMQPAGVDVDMGDAEPTPRRRGR